MSDLRETVFWSNAGYDQILADIQCYWWSQEEYERLPESEQREKRPFKLVELPRPLTPLEETERALDAARLRIAELEAALRETGRVTLEPDVDQCSCGHSWEYCADFPCQDEPR